MNLFSLKALLAEDTVAARLKCYLNPINKAALAEENIELILKAFYFG